jgi:DNA-binding GntR family transcriptional regulator
VTNIEPLIRTKPLAERAYDQVKDLILSSALTPGQVVTETWLSQALGVSRTPVRLALSRLTSEGLMVTVDGQVQVRRICIHEARNVSDLRLAIEGHVARSLAERGLSSQAYEDLQASVAMLTELVDADGQCTDTRQFMLLNRQFHLRLAEETDNALLVEAVDRVLDLMTLTGLTILYIRGRARTVVEEHAAILKSIVSGNPVGAYEAVRIHTIGVDPSEAIGLFATVD